MSDDQIRTALHRLAQRAPAADPVRQTLARRARVNRQRRAILATGAAVAAGAVAPALWLRGHASPSSTGVAGTTPAPAAGGAISSQRVEPAARPGTVGVDLFYRPTWLPDDLVETGRQAALPGPDAPTYQVRVWSRPIGQSHNPNTIPPGVTVGAVPGDSSLPTWAPDPRTEKTIVTVRGRPASAAVAGDDAQVSWQDPDTGQWLRVETHEIAPALATALRVAESVVRDHTPAVLESVVALDRFPFPATGPRVVRTHSSVLDGDAFPASVDRWVHEQFLMNRTAPAQQELYLSLASAWTPLPGGSPLTVRGRSATIEYGDRNAHGAGWVQVRLDDSVWLCVTVGDSYRAELTADDLVRVVEDLHIGPFPTPNWIGTR